MLKRLGEFGLIDMIRDRFRDLPHYGCEGIGDDCAVIPISDRESLVVTTDMLVEDVHFLRSGTPPRLLGRKSLAVSLSDVASMGAAPLASFLSISLPSDVAAGPDGVDEKWVSEFLKGYHEISAEYSVALLGGDTTSSPSKTTISVTAIGHVENSNIKRRRAAAAGDRIFVTGILGESAGGLKEILADDPNSPNAKIHNDPTPAVREGIWLGRQTAVHAMMDISDGLASDLEHILRSSNVSAQVLVDKIPHNSTVEQAITGGEDYKLLFTCRPSEADSLRKMFTADFGYNIYEIGEIVPPTGNSDDRENRIAWLDNGKTITPDWKGFTHF